MSFTVAFCTSPAADLKLLDRLNHVYNNSQEKPDPLKPGGLPPTMFVGVQERKMTKEEVRNTRQSREEPHSFEGWSDAKCANFYEEYFQPERWADHGVFVILDERSSRDDTVVVHYHNPDSTRDDKWESWRVGFEDAEFMMVSLTVNLEEYDITISQAPRFMTPDGVFPALEAARITEKENSGGKAA